MKTFFRKSSSQLLSNSLIWGLVQPVVKFAAMLQFLKGYNQKQEQRQYIISVLGEPVIKNGPFKGMRYPSFVAFGSAIYPKLIGSYEYELRPLIESICASGKYSEIINVGCAEGYYAVGMAIRNPGAKVYAYDTDATARQLCGLIAKLNNVADRVLINGECTSSTLADFRFSRKGLIICDCEGYEKKLFTADNIKFLKNCDILVETHDFIDIEISGYLRNLFSESHSITSIPTIGDIKKAITYSFPETEMLDLKTRRTIFAETRDYDQEWFWMESKNKQ
jgi:hypothetical protein